VKTAGAVPAIRAWLALAAGFFQTLFSEASGVTAEGCPSGLGRPLTRE